MCFPRRRFFLLLLVQPHVRSTIASIKPRKRYCVWRRENEKEGKECVAKSSSKMARTNRRKALTPRTIVRRRRVLFLFFLFFSSLSLSLSFPSSSFFFFFFHSFCPRRRIMVGSTEFLSHCYSQKLVWLDYWIPGGSFIFFSFAARFFTRWNITPPSTHTQCSLSRAHVKRRENGRDEEWVLIPFLLETEVLTSP